MSLELFVNNLNIDVNRAFTDNIYWWDDEAESIETDFSGKTFKSDIVATPGDTTVIQAFTITVTGNLITLSLTKEETELLTPGVYYYDMVIMPEDQNIMIGTVTISNSRTTI